MSKIPVATHYVSVTTSQEDSNLLCLGNLNHGKLKEAVSAHFAAVGIDHKLTSTSILIARQGLPSCVNALESFGMTPVLDDVARCASADQVYQAFGGSCIVDDRIDCYADDTFLGHISAEGMLIDEFLSLAATLRENINKITPFPVSKIVTATSASRNYLEKAHSGVLADLNDLAQNNMMEFVPRAEEQNTIVSSATMAKNINLRSQDGRKVTVAFPKPTELLASLVGQTNFKYNLNSGDAFQGINLAFGGDRPSCSIVSANKKFVDFVVASLSGRTKSFTLDRKTFEDILEFCSMKKVEAFSVIQKRKMQMERDMEPKTFKQVTNDLPIRLNTEISDDHMTSPDRKQLSPDHIITNLKVKPKDLW